MDPVTHTLSALVVSRLGLNRVAPYATPALVVAANVADIDSLCLLVSPAAFLEARAASHSLLGTLALGAGVALAFWHLARRRHPQPQLFIKLLLLCLLGSLSHAWLDWSTPYGLAWWWPAKDTWSALDWFAYIDLWLLAILLLALAVPTLFRLILEEIGARPSEVGRRRGAWVALALCAALAAGRATLHGEAAGQLDARLYHERTALRVAALPVPLNPFRWLAVAETSDTFETGELLLAGPRRGFEASSTYYKPQPSPALESALSGGRTRLFLRWARFPHAQVTPAENGWRIRLEDLRQADAPGPGRLVLWVEVTKDLEVQSEEIRWGAAEDEPNR